MKYSTTSANFFLAYWSIKMTNLASVWLIYFQLLPCNSGMNFDETSQEANTQHPPLSLCFMTDPSAKMAILTSDCLKRFQVLHCNICTNCDETWWAVSNQHSLQLISFWVWSFNSEGRPGLWLAHIINISSATGLLDRFKGNMTERMYF